jgi:type IX secretion system PorP/SprF family membrane protein
MQPTLTRSFPDFSTGILAYSSTVFGGVAIDHLTQPNQAFYGSDASALPMKITAHAGAMIPLEDSKDGSYLSPNVLFQQQGNFQQINFGMYAGKAPLVGGIWFRYAEPTGDALILLVGIQQGNFKFGYSYDVTVSKLANVSGGALRPVKCPTF